MSHSKDNLAFLWSKVQRYLWIFKIVPFVKMVAVCNNLSFEKINQDSDIDFFVICKSGKLYTVRFFLLLFFKIFGLKVSQKSKSGKFCLSFLVDETFMNLDPLVEKNDYYFAFWFSKLKVVYKNDDTVLANFKTENLNWFSRFSENNFEMDLTKVKGNDFSFLKIFSVTFVIFDLFFNNILTSLQLKKARKSTALSNFKKPSIIFENNLVKIHENDRRDFYNKKWFSLEDSDNLGLDQYTLVLD